MPGPFETKQGKNGKTIRFLSKYAEGLTREGPEPYSAFGHQVQVLTSAQNRLGAQPYGVVTADDGKPYTVFAPNSKNYEEVRNLVLSGKNGQGNNRFADADSFDSAVAQAMGAKAVDEAVGSEFVRQANEAHKVAQAVNISTQNAVGNALGNVGKHLVSDDVKLRTQALQAVNLTSEKIAAVHGAAAAEEFKSSVATGLLSGDKKQWGEALTMLGVAQEQFGNVINPEVNTPASFQMPYLKDLPVAGHMAGMAAAGLGAGALAAHLMTQGGQQQHNADYATAIQEMNAY